ncbi:hypothetical protein [Heyndrickxia coagulans]|uniref:hypothetical protein n=1 Tax=Heyndrickxia coagulans TaxID=1398 RepID=UPI002E1A0A6D|nr:hypothetical protein [Heyndrickxia coagulans]
MKMAAGFLAVCLLFAGCSGHMPRKEEREADAASVAENQATVRHFVKGRDLFVECMIPSVTFSGSRHAKPAKIKVYVDGVWKGEYNTAAFVVKGLDKGVHAVQLEVVDKNTGARLGIHRQFYISVS